MGNRLGDLAASVGAELRGDPEIRISGVGTLSGATSGQISFLTNPKYRHYLADTKASAVILSAEDAEHCHTAVVISDNPHLAYARIAAQLFPPARFEPGRHPSAVVDESAAVDASAWIGPCAVVGADVMIGAGVYIGPGCVIEPGCKIAAGSRLVARVTLCRDTELGEQCLIHPGAVLGADGFGLANDQGRWEKVPQLGRVRVGKRVEIGANTTIDRGALEDTVLADGVKLDNLIMIAHNVQVGEDTAMAGLSGIAGSTRIGRGCTFGGASGVVGHIKIGDNVHFSGQALVTRSFERPGYYSSGLPATENSAWKRAVARIRHLDDFAKRLKQLEKQVKELLGNVSQPKD
jgi:UDP-3-O-[3-hydroxymyristoyl] glucosamine N-acyltransferase